MSVERLGCTVVGILAFLVLVLFVVAGMVCGLPCLFVG
jgi:hypothetical protein